MTEYQKGWNDAFDAIADYVEEEVCIITASMIRRMKNEDWRFKEIYKKENKDEVIDENMQ